MKNVLKFIKKCSKKKKLILGGAVAALIIVVIGIIVFTNREPELTIVSEASLKEILDIDDLATLEYFYNSIADVKDEESGKVKYHVSYKGTVRLGIQFEEIKVEIDENNRKVDIILPDVKLIDYNIDPESLDFIFEKDKYETEDVIIEAETVCKTDLKVKAVQDANLKKLAKESAIDAINALLCPWIEQVADEYTVEVK